MTGEEGQLPRCKPFKWTYEKEIVMYAYFKGLDYFCTECIYAPYAARGFTRELVKDLEVMVFLPPSLMWATRVWEKCGGACEVGSSGSLTRFDSDWSGSFYF